MKGYYTYKNSGIEWIGEIPEHWNKLKIGRSFDLIGSGTTPNTNVDKFYNDGNINWLNTGDLNDGYIFNTSKKITEVALKETSLRIFPEDSIVIALYGATIGKLGHLKIETTTNQACCVLSKSNKITNRFLFYFFLASRKNIISMSYGGGQPNISQELIKQLHIPTPSLKEQTQIASFLDYKTNLIDANIEKKKRLIDLLKEKRQAVINEAVTKGLNPNAPMKDSGVEWLGEIPVHWTILKLKHVVEMRSGNFISAEIIEPEGEYPVYGGNGLRGYTSEFTHEGYFPLIGRQGALCGNINYASGKFWATEHAVVVSPLKEINLYWFGELLRLMNLNQYSQASAQPGLSVEKILNLRIPLPTFVEQNLIAEKTKDLNSKIELSELKLKTSIEKLQTYRQSLISEAVTGKIDVRDWEKLTN